MSAGAENIFMSGVDFTVETKPLLEKETVLASRLSPPDAVVFDSLAQKGESPRLHPDWAVFNTAILGNIYVSRAVHIPSLQEDVPDMNVLVVAREREKGKFERLADLGLPIGAGEGEVFNWEDVRVLNLSGKVEPKSLLGLTAVRIEQNKFVPHPALVEISLKNGDLVVGSTVVFDEVGKNVVPLDKEKFIYRPELKSHSLHLLVKPTAENKLALIKEIDFSNYSQVDWMRKKVGTVARPIDIGGNLRLLPIHGVREGIGIDGEPKDDVYSIGFAIIDNDWNIQAVSAKPLWKREDFLTNLPYGQGLRGDRKKEVVYLDDWVRRGETFEFPLNIGDRITVIDRKNLSQLLDQPFIGFSDSTGSYQKFTLPMDELKEFAASAV